MASKIAISESVGLLGLFQALFALVVGALFTLMLLFGEPVEKR